MGKDKKNHRTRLVAFRVTDEEFRTLEKAAKSQERTLSNWIRWEIKLDERMRLMRSIPT